MCGIAGIVDLKKRSDLSGITERMLSAIHHRGPDESGVYQCPQATMGNVRLSIIDILGGHQPLSDHSGRYWIVFNGEIFNYLELSRIIESRGLYLRTKSDTEVLLLLYCLLGEKCLELLNGQFAFAIWDNLGKELFLARDRVGICPLFYHLSNGVFSFASEIKALFCQKQISRELSPESLAQITTFWTTLSPCTAFRNIFEIPAGHYARFSAKGLKTTSYWQLKFGPASLQISLKDAQEQFHEIFYNAVKIRLRADVEVAAYLSGGIDSTTNVAYIQSIEPRILNTFSIGFADENFDESKYQNEAVQYLNTSHKSFICNADDIRMAFPSVVWHTEMPLTRTAPTPMLLLSRLVKEHNIKVVMTGEGSDEILAGYDIFKESSIRRFWASQPASGIRPLLLKKLYPYIPHLAQASPSILKMFFGYKLEDVNNPFYSHLLRWNNAQHISKHFSVSLRNLLSSYSPVDSLQEKLPGQFGQWDTLSRSQWLETEIFMSGYLLSSQGDRMTMANSVEGRYPFLDHRLIEFCSTLPPEFKLRGLTEKYLLKKLMKNRIPESILSRAKQPYRAPIANAFFSGTPPEYVKEFLSESFIKKAGIFNSRTLFPVLQRLAKPGAVSETDDMLLAFVLSTHLVYHLFIEDQNEAFQSGLMQNPKVVQAIPFRIQGNTEL